MPDIPCRAAHSEDRAVPIVHLFRDGPYDDRIGRPVIGFHFHAVPRLSAEHRFAQGCFPTDAPLQRVAPNRGHDLYRFDFIVLISGLS